MINNTLFIASDCVFMLTCMFNVLLLACVILMAHMQSHDPLKETPSSLEYYTHTS